MKLEILETLTVCWAVVVRGTTTVATASRAGVVAMVTLRVCHVAVAKRLTNGGRVLSWRRFVEQSFFGGGVDFYISVQCVDFCIGVQCFFRDGADFYIVVRYSCGSRTFKSKNRYKKKNATVLNLNSTGEAVSFTEHKALKAKRPRQRQNQFVSP